MSHPTNFPYQVLPGEKRGRADSHDPQLSILVNGGRYLEVRGGRGVTAVVLSFLPHLRITVGTPCISAAERKILLLLSHPYPSPRVSFLDGSEGNALFFFFLSSFT